MPELIDIAVVLAFMLAILAGAAIGYFLFLNEEDRR